MITRGSFSARVMIMSIYPKSKQLLISRLKNGISFVVVAGLFCAACWGIFENTSDEEIIGLSETQLDADIASGLGAMGVNSSAVDTTDSAVESTHLPFEISSDDQTNEASGSNDRTLIQDPAVQITSNTTSNSGPLFPITQDNSAPDFSNQQQQQRSVQQERQATNRVPATVNKQAAWFTGKIEFE
jgi:hypothetical protein